ncbi:MAG: glycosyltransferase family 2 protein [Syntrophales bacterium LBB04]|nr:glycosyltransferase family 2 protein [Syntrophales bacterium LBB04]
MNKIAFLSVVFPEVQCYLNDFLSSLDSQTMKDFDCLIAKDNFPGFDRYAGKYPGLNIVSFDVSGSHAAIRKKALQKIRTSKYDVVIFGDSDDYYAKTGLRLSRGWPKMRYPCK